MINQSDKTNHMQTIFTIHNIYIFSIEFNKFNNKKIVYKKVYKVFDKASYVVFKIFQ